MAVNAPLAHDAKSSSSFLSTFLPIVIAVLNVDLVGLLTCTRVDIASLWSRFGCHSVASVVTIIYDWGYDRGIVRMNGRRDRVRMRHVWSIWKGLGLILLMTFGNVGRKHILTNNAAIDDHIVHSFNDLKEGDLLADNGLLAGKVLKEDLLPKFDHAIGI